MKINELSLNRKRYIIHFSFMFMFILTGFSSQIINMGWGLDILLGSMGMLIGYAVALNVEDQIEKQLGKASDE